MQRSSPSFTVLLPYAALTHLTRQPTPVGAIKSSSALESEKHTTAKDTECEEECAWQNYKDEALSSHRFKPVRGKKKHKKKDDKSVTESYRASEERDSFYNPKDFLLCWYNN